MPASNPLDVLENPKATLYEHASALAAIINYGELELTFVQLGTMQPEYNFKSPIYNCNIQVSLYLDANEMVVRLTTASNSIHIFPLRLQDSYDRGKVNIGYARYRGNQSLSVILHHTRNLVSVIL